MKINNVTKNSNPVLVPIIWIFWVGPIINLLEWFSNDFPAFNVTGGSNEYNIVPALLVTLISKLMSFVVEEFTIETNLINLLFELELVYKSVQVFAVYVLFYDWSPILLPIVI